VEGPAGLPDEVARMGIAMKAPALVSPDAPAALADPRATGGAALPDISAYPIARRLHLGRWTAVAIICLLLALLARAFAVGQIEWVFVGRFFTAPVILEGLLNTVVMAVAAMALGIVLGIITAIMRITPNPVLRGVAMGYVWLFRGTPLILQLLLWFNLALIFPVIGFPGLWSARTVVVMTPIMAALLGLGINQGAYTSEVIRAGMLSVDIGQYEAAKSIGMTPLVSLRRIIFPQAMRVIIPPLGNEFIGMVKLTSLASIVQFPEILHNAQNIYYANSRVIELLIVAAIWYLIVVSVLTPLQMLLERRFSRGTRTGR
jgi:polar amino acid transport system permease protein